MNAPAPGFRALFEPRSIALVGATEAQEKLAGRRWRSLIDGQFGGALYPVHPSATQVRGVRAYPTVRDLPQAPDLAVIAVPAAVVPGVARACADIGVGAAVVLSGGFGESGAVGQALEDELVSVFAEAGIPMVGPNCAGLVSTPCRVNLMGWHAPPGGVGVISQSGNVALHLGYLARLHGGGFSRVLSIGNASAVGVVPLLRALLDDLETHAVIIYLEGWREDEGKLFFDAVERSAAKKPIIIICPGSTEFGRRAALSHTRALAASSRLLDGVAQRLGLLRTEDLEVAWHVANRLGRGHRMNDERVMVLTDGGGHATLVSDALGAAGLGMLELDDTSSVKLRRDLPPICTVHNPLDFAGVAESAPRVVADTLQICLQFESAGAVVMAGHFGGYHRVGGEALLAQEVAAANSIAAAALTDKPVFVYSVHANEPLPTFAPLREIGITVCASARSIAEVAELMRRGSVRKPAGTGSGAGASVGADAFGTILSRAVDGPESWLMEPEARELLNALGLRIERYFVSSDHVAAREHAVSLLREHAGVVLKGISPDHPHKSDSGGVQLALRAAQDLEVAMAALPQRTWPRLLVAPQLSGVELVIGGVNDRQFGPCVMVGIGGVSVETLADVLYTPAPLTADAARRVIQSLRVWPLLSGHRGRAPVHLAALDALLVKLGDILCRCSWIESIDLNPVMVTSKDVSIADARIVLATGVRSGLRPHPA